MVLREKRVEGENQILLLGVSLWTVCIFLLCSEEWIDLGLQAQFGLFCSWLRPGKQNNLGITACISEPTERLLLGPN